MPSSHHNLRRVFLQGFVVQDVARPLVSFDDFAPAGKVKEVLDATGDDVAGVRRHGIVRSVVDRDELGDASCGDHARPIESACCVSDTLPLAELVLRLKDRERLFVTALGQVSGVVSRTDLLQPAARMWLFGMITLLEMRFNRLIETHFPGDSWTASVSEGRIQKARGLQDERKRHKQNVTLLDCLQFADKTQIIARNDELRQLTRFVSKRQVEEAGKRLEKLRNNLAHSQDIVANDWTTIVELVENLDSVLDGPPGLSRAEF
ncbi:MAG TPA: hypothetical protein VM510_15695 [Caulifigura sp.]|nr:hypothetical protein [Caulifigura sp.]